MKQLFINQSGDSNKFWSIVQEENSFTVNWGKIGTEGRISTKQFSDNILCEKEIEKLTKEKIKKGYIKIDDSTLIPSKPIQEYRTMDENVFWETISSFNWKKTGDDDAVLKPALNKLVSMTIDDIYKFADILSEKLYLLDGIEYASNIGEDSYKNDKEHFSVDYFLYVRCCVVANGKDYFNQVIANPTQMPEEMDFESLLYLPDEAFNKKTKTETYDYQPKINFETFSNKAGWKSSETKSKSKWKFWQ
jgi:predicted DNA-binding WGR domain protein